MNFNSCMTFVAFVTIVIGLLVIMNIFLDGYWGI